MGHHQKKRAKVEKTAHVCVCGMDLRKFDQKQNYYVKSKNWERKEGSFSICSLSWVSSSFHPLDGQWEKKRQQAMRVKWIPKISTHNFFFAFLFSFGEKKKKFWENEEQIVLEKEKAD